MQRADAITPAKRPIARSVAYVLGLIVGLALHPRSLEAAPLALVVSSERSERALDCADDAALYAKVQGLTRRVLTVDPASANTLHVLARFDRHANEYIALLHFDGVKSGERRFRDVAADCASLEDAVAVAIVLLLDSELDGREPTPEPVQRVVPTILSLKGTVSTVPRANIVNDWTLAARGGAVWGFTASTTAWFSLHLGIALRDGWQTHIGALAFLPQTLAYAPGAVSISLLAVEWRVCKLWGSSLLFGACVAPTIGRLRGVGRGFDESSSVDLVWSAMAGSLLLQMPLGRRWFVGLEGVSWVPLVERRFLVQGLGTGWNSSAIWGGGDLHLGVRLM
ncbi:MAG TPA: hypothetical protein VIV60_00260 [Polyangiaceae bacterium]